VAALYNFPQATGKGQTIALIELGGGFTESDMTQYFQSLGLNTPSITAVSVQGAANNPTGDPSGPDGEVELDIQVAGAVAPDANIAVYFAENSDKGFLDAVTAAVHDANTPSIISISWGQAEDAWSDQSMQAFNDVFKDAAMQGISVLVASGDDGSNDNVNDGQNHVDFPASCPFVLACGGTRLTTDGQNGIQDETAWGGNNDGAGGGGISGVFDTPSYQQSGIQPPPAMRGVPDVAGNADPETGYQVFVDGTDQTIGGTSAVAPLYAGLIALVNEIIQGNCGMLHPLLYSNQSICRDVTQGTNGAFDAGPGWDPTTGLGSINGSDLLSGISAAQVQAA
jgi:kumamolisin